jgi:hypothetical protein
MSKLNFDQALERIGDDLPIERADVLASALKRKVWCGYYLAPGCLPDHRWYDTTARGCIEQAIEIYADDAPPGFRSGLRHSHCATTDAQRYYRVSIERNTLADIL